MNDLIKQDGLGNDVLSIQEFDKRYKRTGQNLASLNIKFVIEKIKDRNDENIVKVAKQAKRDKQSDFCDELLIKWIVMKKLGILEDCELYSDDKSVILVQKFWKTDLYRYIYFCEHSKTNENMFTNIEENVALFMKTICPKLKKIHDQGLVYTDMKPLNLVMDYDEKTNKPIRFGIIDFELLTETNDSFHLRGGTTHYRAPESIRYWREEGYRFTTKYDIFGLGISLLEMITYQNPIDNRKEETDSAIKQTETAIIIYGSRLLQMEQNKEFKDLLYQMLKGDVDERYDINQVMNHPWYKKYCT